MYSICSILCSLLTTATATATATAAAAAAATDDGSAKPLIWAWGLRNPWKCRFDRIQYDNPTLWCGDVGQDMVEKVLCNCQFCNAQA
jgi:glucose/arabinose dehydrogenase